MFALGAGLAYLLLCPNLSLSDISVPSMSGAQGSSGPQYREIGSAEGFNYDSGDDEEPDDFNDDPTGRKRMTELASFSSNTGASSGSAAAPAAQSQSSSFPRTDFSMGAAADSSEVTADAAAEADLQNELELFAQGDDEAENALIDMAEQEQP